MTISLFLPLWDIVKPAEVRVLQPNQQTEGNATLTCCFLQPTQTQDFFQLKNAFISLIYCRLLRETFITSGKVVAECGSSLQGEQLMANDETNLLSPKLCSSSQSRMLVKKRRVSSSECLSKRSHEQLLYLFNNLKHFFIECLLWSGIILSARDTMVSKATPSLQLTDSWWRTDARRGNSITVCYCTQLYRAVHH